MRTRRATRVSVSDKAAAVPNRSSRITIVPSVNVAVVGASGAVGERMVRLLEERNFPARSIRFLASERSAGRLVTFRGEPRPIEPIRAEAFRGVQIVLSSTPGTVSKQWSPVAAEAGAVVIDNSSAFRMEPDVPLVVPEVNPADVERHRGIIANPNCSTIQMVVALKPLHDAARVRRVVVSTYQSVSGAGMKGLDELESQTRAHARGDAAPAPAKFPHAILGNCIPQIDEFLPNGFTKEEFKMINETRKIMGDPSIDVCPTCVRVPVPLSHSEAIAVELERPVSAVEARALWAKAPGVTVVDDPSRRQYPLAATAANRDDVFIGRIRQDLHRPEVLLFWCVSDNLRKGAATNAVQIAEEVLRRGAYRQG
jgi:aspartate-semialdehyde dehydrogenase